MRKRNIKKPGFSLAILAILVLTGLAGVYANVPVTGITIDKRELTLERYDTATLTAGVLPAEATNKEVSWYSSDSDIVKIIGITGLTATIEAYNGGEANIYVTAGDGDFSTLCQVTVLVSVRSIQIEPQEVTIPPGEEYLFEARVQPDDASNKDIIWQSSDNRVVNVDETGLAYAYAAGEARVIARSAENEEIFSYSNVTVADPDDGTEEGEPVSEQPENVSDPEQEDEEKIEEEVAPTDNDHFGATGGNTFVYLAVGAILLLIVILTVFMIRQRKMA